jgi:hypothetical protein
MALGNDKIGFAKGNQNDKIFKKGLGKEKTTNF